MSEVHIGTMNSTMRLMDSQSMISPEVFERIVEAVIARVREEDAHQRRATAERQVRPGASSSDSPNWD